MRRLVIILSSCAVALAGLSGVAHAGDGFNLPGSDHANPRSSAATPAAAIPGCRVWTWVKPGVQGAAGRCWLKSPVPSPVKGRLLLVGVAPQHPTERHEGGSRTNRPGQDLRNSEMDS